MERNKIHHGDCLEIMKTLPDASIDLVVTDPPYNMNYHGRGKVNSFEEFANDNMDADAHSEWFEQVLQQFDRLLKDNTALYIWIDFRNYARIYNLIAKYFDVKNCIVWDKEHFGMGASYRFQHEFCIYAVKGKPTLRFEKKNVPDVWRFKKDSVSEYAHPTQKPLDAMAKPILYSSDEGGVILDPFLGSGTTAVACQQLKRDFIGIELDNKYVEVASSRVAQKGLF